MGYTLVILIETSIFSHEIDRLLSEDEHWALQVALFRNPHAGAVIPGSGGCRKLRWGAGNRGKRGGIRVIYFAVPGQARLLLLYAYDKRKVNDLTRSEVSALSSLVVSELSEK